MVSKRRAQMFKTKPWEWNWKQAFLGRIQSSFFPHLFIKNNGKVLTPSVPNTFLENEIWSERARLQGRGCEPAVVSDAGWYHWTHCKVAVCVDRGGKVDRVRFYFVGFIYAFVLVSFIFSASRWLFNVYVNISICQLQLNLSSVWPPFIPFMPSFCLEYFVSQQRLWT